MKLLLTLKHWQLFLLLLVYSFWFFDTPIFNTVAYIGIALFVLWAFAIGYYGQREIERSGLKHMSVPLLICSIIFILATIVAIKFYTELPWLLSGTMDRILPMMLFISIIAGIYVFFFAAKTIAKIEYQREVKFDDYFMNFLMITIFIWGIWILQPKINRLINTQVSRS